MITGIGVSFHFQLFDLLKINFSALIYYLEALQRIYWLFNGLGQKAWILGSNNLQKNWSLEICKDTTQILCLEHKKIRRETPHTSQHDLQP